MTSETFKIPSAENNEAEKDKAETRREETPKGRRICAWCKKDLGGAKTKEDTHTVCPECKVTIRKEENLS